MGIFKKLKTKVMKGLITKLLSGWLQKLNPKVYKTIVTVVAGLMGAALVPEVQAELGDVGFWVLEGLGVLTLALTGSTPGPNGEIAEPETEG